LRYFHGLDITFIKVCGNGGPSAYTIGSPSGQAYTKLGILLMLFLIWCLLTALYRNVVLGVPGLEAFPILGTIDQELRKRVGLIRPAG
jgi:hypothetical protein